MSAISPTRMFVHAGEQAHVVAVIVHEFGLLSFPEPYGHLLTMLVIIPATSIVIRWWKRVFSAGAYVLSSLAAGLYWLAEIPAKTHKLLVRARKMLGRWLIRRRDDD